VGQDYYTVTKRRPFQFTCLTENHRIDGYVNTSTRRLLDYLNGDSVESVIAADNVTVQIGPKEAEKTSLGRVDIRTDSVLLVVPIEEGPAPQPDMSVRATLSIERVLLGVGQYLVMGDAYLPKATRGRGVINSTEKRFMALTDAVIKHKNGTAFQMRARIVLVSRRGVEFVGTVLPSV
jgi:hypothetical protein